MIVVPVVGDQDVDPRLLLGWEAARAVLRAAPAFGSRAAEDRYLGVTSGQRGRLDRAQTLLSRGRQAYLDLELDTAISTFREAIEIFDANLGATGDLPDRIEALQLLGASLVFADRSVEARRVLERLRVQFPDARLDPTTFNEAVVEAYEEAVLPRDRANPMGHIEVQSDGERAFVYVDHAPRGVAPLTVDGLMGGSHVVCVVRPGSPPFVQTVELATGGTASIRAVLRDTDLSRTSDAVTQLSRDGLGDTAPEAIVALGQALEVELVGLLSSDADAARTEFIVYEVATRRRVLRAGVRAPSEPPAFAETVTELVSANLPRLGGAMQETDGESSFEPATLALDDPPDGEPEVYEQWWFWTAIAGGALLTAGLVFLLTPGDDAPTGGGEVVLVF